MSHPAAPVGVPPASVSTHLRLEGLALLAVVVASYATIGANWWLFAGLLLVPDITMLGLLAGEKIGAHVYNAGHNPALPAGLIIIAHYTGASWMTPLALIWLAHIGMDRALGFGLKYPGLNHQTHLGMIGKRSKDQSELAHAG